MRKEDGEHGGGVEERKRRPWKRREEEKLEARAGGRVEEGKVVEASG